MASKPPPSHHSPSPDSHRSKARRLPLLQLPNLQAFAGVVATTDKNGHYTLTGLPTGISVIIVATQKIGDTTIRLSTFVENVTNVTRADIDIATTLATEVLAKKLKDSNGGYQANSVDFETARYAAESVASTYPWTLENMAVGGPLFPKHLGEGLVDADGDFGNIQFPEVPDTDIQLAKSMVQAIRNAGYSAVNTLETKLYKIAADFTEESADYLVHIGEIILYLKDMARVVVEYPPGEITVDEYGWFDWSPGQDDDKWAFVDAQGGVYLTITLVGDNAYYLEAPVLGGKYTLEYALCRERRSVRPQWGDGAWSDDRRVGGKSGRAAVGFNRTGSAAFRLVRSIAF